MWGCQTQGGIAQNHKFSNKTNNFPKWRKIRNILFCRRYLIWFRFQFEGKNDVWIVQVLDINYVYVICNNTDWYMYVLNWNKLLQNKTKTSNMCWLCELSSHYTFLFYALVSSAMNEENWWKRFPLWGETQTNFIKNALQTRRL